ncbi:MAG: FGGY-family carbohydrate kinase [Geminicoccaceae bacterium]|nr:FGGY-family carbohydrate kinase [Geminicoccaceae bacterium]
MADRYFLGIDCGTSGMRAVVIDDDGRIVFDAKENLPASRLHDDGRVTQDPHDWEKALPRLLDALPAVDALAVDGTSGTLLLTDEAGEPLGPARMYDDRGSAAHAGRIGKVAPPECGAHGAASPLARLLDAQREYPRAARAMFQADWLAMKLGAPPGISDENNVLKLGYDPVRREWPSWMDDLGVRRDLLPRVAAPGAVISSGPGKPMILAGTTDGCASFLATGADQVGDAVTALGSTLTLKLMSDKPVFAPELGVYSHRMGDRWLAGGASNSGGKALLRFFTAPEMEKLSGQLHPGRPTGMCWHPLAGTGERFPVQDDALTFEPADRPADDAMFLQALFEGIADVEARGYEALRSHGAPALRSLRTVGGGAGNRAWQTIRENRLGIGMTEALSVEAAYGTARLARQGYHDATR